MKKSVDETIENIADMLDKEITAIESIYELLRDFAGDYKNKSEEKINGTNG